ncbi:hypothetical protein [Teredinibacter purpureus]|jgi:hypothetical protein|uniref:hypothetical protein n=1 Tax=Teredinibacter purpureus TaxID=2731756 RepID=UPI0005F784E6|nr:hypothetical protein [Teredinibacter purpureus]
MKRMKKYMWLLIGVLSVSGCIPTITKIYDAPNVSGEVVGWPNLEPIANAEIQYIHRNEDNAWAAKAIRARHSDNNAENLDRQLPGVFSEADGWSDAQGLYAIEADYSLKPTLLMVGYALDEYPVRVAANGYATGIVFATGSLKIQDVEFAYAPALVLDEHPLVVAPPVIEDGLSYHELNTYFYTHNVFGECNAHVGGYALSALNVFRKLQARVESTDSTISHRDIQYANPARLNAVTLWKYFEQSCRDGTSTSEGYTTRFAQHDIVKQILTELQHE